MSSSTWFGEAAAYERKQREDGASDARGAALGAEERAELERLRAEVAALRSQVQAGGTGGGRPDRRGGWTAGAGARS